MYDLYDPKKLQVTPGHYDFTKAHGYDEELTRHNLNHVVRPAHIHRVVPSLIKEVIKKEKPNFVKQNKRGMGEVSSINLKAAEKMKKQNAMKRKKRVQSCNTTQRSEITRVSTEHASSYQ